MSLPHTSCRGSLPTWFASLFFLYGDNFSIRTVFFVSFFSTFLNHLSTFLPYRDLSILFIDTHGEPSHSEGAAVSLLAAGGASLKPHHDTKHTTYNILVYYLSYNSTTR